MRCPIERRSLQNEIRSKRTLTNIDAQQLRFEDLSIIIQSEIILQIVEEASELDLYYSIYWPAQILLNVPRDELISIVNTHADGPIMNQHEKDGIQYFDSPTAVQLELAKQYLLQEDLPLSLLGDFLSQLPNFQDRKDPEEIATLPNMGTTDSPGMVDKEIQTEDWILCSCKGGGAKRSSDTNKLQVLGTVRSDLPRPNASRSDVKARIEQNSTVSLHLIASFNKLTNESLVQASMGVSTETPNLCATSAHPDVVSPNDQISITKIDG